MSKKLKRIATDCVYELIGNILIAVGTYNIALTASFPMAGFSGIAMILYRLFGFKMGLTTLLMNIPFLLICYKKIGKDFILRSLRCMLFNSLLLDYAAPLFPVYEGDRMLAALLTGVLCGMGYALIYTRASSTGGMDFVMILIKSIVPHVKTGTITFALDFLIVCTTGLIFRDFDGVIYGIIIDFLLAYVVDKFILGMNSGNVAMIVTENGKQACKIINEVCERGCTVFKANGGYTGLPKEVVMVAGTSKDIYQINRAMKRVDPESFTIILDSKEVHGEGFHITKMAGE